MNDESLDQVEQQLSRLRPPDAAAEVRAAVLADVRRELRANRWDRWLARAAAVLLAVGVGLNASLVVWSGMATSSGSEPLVGDPSKDALAETAVRMADATDAATGRLLARHMLALSGRQLGAGDTAVIDRAIENRDPQSDVNGGDG